MQDLKHVTRKKPFWSSLFSNSRPNRIRPRLEETQPVSRGKSDRKVFRYVLPLLALLLAAYPISGLVMNLVNRPTPSPKKSASAAIGPVAPLTTWQSFQWAAQVLPSAEPSGTSFVAPLPAGGNVTYTFNQELQESVHDFLAANRVPYGVFIAMDPKTGHVLAMTAYSEDNPDWPASSFYQLYPMASLFKIITASAALEQKKVRPETVVEFRGKLTSESPRYWAPGKKQNNQMGIDVAMGKSVNPVFGRIANDIVGKDSLLAYTERFGFNQHLFPQTQIVPSRASTPATPEDLMLMGAGLGRDVKLSPFHAAAITATVANQGMMMAPILARDIRGPNNQSLFSPTPQPLRRVVSPETADQLTRMLVTTVKSGTSRRAFHDRRGRKLLGPLTIAAKTGSINGTDPAGHYSWFAAYAPVENPRIALVAMVVNHDRWKIKATHVGEKALEAYFRE